MISMVRLKKKSCKTLIKESALLILLTIFGMFYLLLIVVIDLVYFIKSLFKSKSEMLLKNTEEYDSNGFEDIHPEMFKLLMKLLNLNRGRDINLRDFIQYLRAKMKVVDVISKMIFYVDNKEEVFMRSFTKARTDRLIVSKEAHPFFKIQPVNLPSLEDLPPDPVQDESMLYRDPDEHFESITFDDEDQQSAENKILTQIESYLSNKQPKFILAQFHAIKKFLISNSIPQIKKDHLKTFTLNISRTLSITSKGWNNEARQKSLSSPVLSKQKSIPKIIPKKLYALITEESQKKKYREIIIGIKGKNIRKFKTGLTKVGMRDVKDHLADENTNRPMNEFTEEKPSFFSQNYTSPDYSNIKMLRLSRNWESINYKEF